MIKTIPAVLRTSGILRGFNETDFFAAITSPRTNHFSSSSRVSDTTQRMPLHALTIETTPGVDLNYLSDALIELGAISVTVQDLNQNTALAQMITREPCSNMLTAPSSDRLDWENAELEYWKRGRVKAMFEEGFGGKEEVILRLGAEFGLGREMGYRVVEVVEVEEGGVERDWVREAQMGCRPVKIGRVMVRFPWSSDEEVRTVVEENGNEDGGVDVSVVIEPGIAFGTGEHPTTQLVIRWLQQTIDGGETVLDYGCGSGILGITARLLGAKAVVGVDIDPEAVTASIENACRNFDEDDVIHISFGSSALEEENGHAEGGYDVVVANILAEPLKELASLLVFRMRVGGRIALAGILASQAESVAMVYRSLGVIIDVAEIQSEWALVSGYRFRD